MPSLDGEPDSPPSVLTSDNDVYWYLKDRMRGGNTDFNQRPLYKYAERRDFQVEPLEPRPAAYLVNILLENLSAEPAGDRVIQCWVPARNHRIRTLKEKLDAWGYEIVGVQRTNRVATRGVPLLEITCQQAPSPAAQLRALGAVDTDAAEFLDAWGTVIRNRHAPPDESINIREWAALRGVPEDEVRANAEAVQKELQDVGGLPGTQWEIREDGGIPVTQE